MAELEKLVEGGWSMRFVNFVMAWHELHNLTEAHIQDEQANEIQRKTHRPRAPRKARRR